jgi:hypothetical protein
MKTLLTSILFLTSLFNYAQSNRVYGEAYIKDVNILNDTLLRKNYSYTMYYAKDSIADTAKKKISKRSGYTFDFKISKFKLRKYQYIHFESFDHIIVLKISEILNSKQTLIFDSIKVDEMPSHHVEK